MYVLFNVQNMSSEVVTDYESYSMQCSFFS